jgi:four helix bundle protein
LQKALAVFTIKCRQSRSSLHELIDQLITAKDDGYIQDDEYTDGRKLISKALALLNGYVNYLSQQKERITHNI